MEGVHLNTDHHMVARDARHVWYAAQDLARDRANKLITRGGFSHVYHEMEGEGMVY